MKGVTIVICSYNGSPRLKDTLDHLLVQKCRPGIAVELVFVDNRSTDGTYEFVKSHLHVMPDFLSVKLLQETRPGKAYALELAYDTATYDYVVTCDDDNWLCPDYIQTAYDLMERLPEAGLIGCMTIGKFEVAPPEWFSLVAPLYAVGDQANSEGYYENKSDYVWGAGMVFRKSIWTYLRKMDFEFITGKNVSKAVGEDGELSIIVKALGYRFYYSKLLYLHHFIPKDRLTWKKCINMFSGFGYTDLYFDVYRNSFRSGRSGNQVWSYRLKRSLFYMYRLLTILISSKFAPWSPMNECEGSWLKLKYVERLAGLKELLLSGNFKHNEVRIRTFASNIATRINARSIPIVQNEFKD